MTLIEIGLREQPVNVSARHEDYLFRDARKAMVVRVFSQFREGDAPQNLRIDGKWSNNSYSIILFLRKPAVIKRHVAFFLVNHAI